MTGEVKLHVGPGIRGRDFDGEVVASWDGPVQPARTTARQQAAASWYCDPVAESPVRSGGQLRSYVGAWCYNGPMPTYRLQWQFERNAVDLLESITGWKQFSARRYTSWTTSMSAGTTVFARCNSADGRSRAYTTYHRGETTGGYYWAWNRSHTSVTWLPCGFREF
jgi:hypothetical protein